MTKKPPKQPWGEAEEEKVANEIRFLPLFDLWTGKHEGGGEIFGALTLVLGLGALAALIWKLLF